MTVIQPTLNCNQCVSCQPKT